MFYSSTKLPLVLALCLFTGVVVVAVQPMPGRANLLDCEATWDAESLTVRNSKIERRWTFANGLLRAVSLRDRVSGREWSIKPGDYPAPSPEFLISEPCTQLEVSAAPKREVVVEAEALQVRVRSSYSDANLTTIVRIFPATGAITTQLQINTPRKNQVSKVNSKSDIDTAKKPAVDGTENNLILSVARDEPVDLTDSLNISPIHRTLSWVDFMDDTDRNDNLVHVRTDLLTVPGPHHLPSTHIYQSNLIYIEDQFSADGLVFLKEAPLPHARPVNSRYDLLRKNGNLYFYGLGAGDEPSRESYPQTVMVYRGGRAGRIAILQEYQRQHRPFDATRDVRVWHSIWGDRNRDGKVSEEFMMAELDRQKELGMDFSYFIDGWQNGPSSNSVLPGGRWENQWAVADYWKANSTRFPNGLGPVAKKASELGIIRGVWYNPDKTNDYANWQKDTDVILGLYREIGATWFKYDGVVFTNKRGERNLLAAMHRVVEESQGAASISIDISAGVRTGYWAAMPYGELFLENRYTDLHRYWPHCTLRNLWQLAHFVDPHRLRMEFLNPERNAHLYRDDPLAPANYGIDYLYASVMFASPMAWLETSGLSAKSGSLLRAIIAAHRPHWEAIKNGVVFPIGEEPNGLSWTGFQSHTASKNAGFIVVLRELNKLSERTLALERIVPGRYQFESIAGHGASFTADIGKEGIVKFSLPTAFNFGFYHYKAVEIRP